MRWRHWVALSFAVAAVVLALLLAIVYSLLILVSDAGDPEEIQDRAKEAFGARFPHQQITGLRVKYPVYRNCGVVGIKTSVGDKENTFVVWKQNDGWRISKNPNARLDDSYSPPESDCIQFGEDGD